LYFLSPFQKLCLPNSSSFYLGPFGDERTPPKTFILFLTVDITFIQSFCSWDAMDMISGHSCVKKPPNQPTSFLKKGRKESPFLFFMRPYELIELCSKASSRV